MAFSAPHDKYCVNVPHAIYTAPHQHQEETVHERQSILQARRLRNWDNGLCGAEEIRIDREGYCATYEEIPEETDDELDLPAHVDDLTWEDDEDEDLEIEELGQEGWNDLEDEGEEDEDEEGDSGTDDDRWND